MMARDANGAIVTREYAVVSNARALHKTVFRRYIYIYIIGVFRLRRSRSFYNKSYARISHRFSFSKKINLKTQNENMGLNRNPSYRLAEGHYNRIYYDEIGYFFRIYLYRTYRPKRYIGRNNNIKQAYIIPLYIISSRLTVRVHSIFNGH